MALIIVPLMMLLLGIFELAFDFYAQQALDYALTKSVRQVATGNLQSSATSLSTFMSSSFCPAVSSFLPCASIAVNVTPATGLSSANTAIPMTNGAFDPSGFKYCPGLPGTLMLAQAVYPAPTFLGLLIPGTGTTSYNGQTVRLISSTAGFVNEPYTATSSAPGGC